MEFFDWLSIPQFFQDLYLEYYLTGAGEVTREEVANAILRTSYISLAVAGGLYLIFLILGGVGLNVMAKRAGMKQSVLAYIPFANTLYAGKIAGEASFFGQKMKRAGLYAMIAEILFAGLEIFRIILNDLITNPAYLTQVKSGTSDSTYWQIDRASIPESLRWQYDALTYSGYVSYILQFVVIILLFTLFLALFRKYYARSPILMTVICTFFPFRGATIFAVRNNTPVNYNEYMRRRAEEYARRNQPYGAGQGYGGNPYGSAPGGTQNSPSGTSATPQDDPFKEFGGTQNDDPFDFDNKN